MEVATTWIFQDANEDRPQPHRLLSRSPASSKPRHVCNSAVEQALASIPVYNQQTEAPQVPLLTSARVTT